MIRTGGCIEDVLGDCADIEIHAAIPAASTHDDPIWPQLFVNLYARQDNRALGIVLGIVQRSGHTV